MSSLRVLLVDGDSREAARVVQLLSHANHSVFDASGFDQASEALQLQRFDAVLLGASVSRSEVPRFAAGLRDLELRQKLPSRIPVLSISSRIAEDPGWSRAQESPPDAYLAPRFRPDTLASAIEALANGISQHSPEVPELSEIFSPDRFGDQCVGEPELMAEIIDLFLVEHQGQLEAMARALANSRYEQLSRTAHTIKGSLASLHAPRGRHCAASLEAAASRQDGRECHTSMLALESALAQLKPVLQSFRNQILPQ